MCYCLTQAGVYWYGGALSEAALFRRTVVKPALANLEIGLAKSDPGVYCGNLINCGID